MNTQETAAERMRLEALGVLQKRGRKLKHPNYPGICVRCLDRGKVPPEAKPKKGQSSYCSSCQSESVLASQEGKRSHKDFVRGNWDRLPEPVRFRQESIAAKKVLEATAPARTMRQARQLAWAFEYACVQYVIDKQRRMTKAEEDAIIDAFHGSRDPDQSVRVEWVIKPGPDQLPVETGEAGQEGPRPPRRIRLPDDSVRFEFRADMRGGPTTEGEPTFAQYFEAKHGMLPDKIYLEDADQVEEELLLEGLVQAIAPSMRAQYERVLNKAWAQTPLQTWERQLLHGVDSEGNSYDYRNDDLKDFMSPDEPDKAEKLNTDKAMRKQELTGSFSEMASQVPP